LATLKKLEILELRYPTSVTKKGLKTLKEAQPKLEIVRTKPEP